MWRSVPVASLWDLLVWWPLAQRKWYQVCSTITHEHYVTLWNQTNTSMLTVVFPQNWWHEWWSGTFFVIIIQKKKKSPLCIDSMSLTQCVLQCLFLTHFWTCFQGSGDKAHAVLTGEVEDVPCGLIISSIGYKSTLIDPSVPFDSRRAIVPNTNGRVQQAAGVYSQNIIKKAT